MWDHTTFESFNPLIFCFGPKATALYHHSIRPFFNLDYIPQLASLVCTSSGPLLLAANRVDARLA